MAGASTADLDMDAAIDSFSSGGEQGQQTARGGATAVGNGHIDDDVARILASVGAGGDAINGLGSGEVQSDYDPDSLDGDPGEATGGW